MPPPSPEICRAVAKAWSLPATEVEGLASAPGATAESLSAAAMVAKRTGKSPAEVWALRAQATTWAEASRKAGLDPEKTVSTLQGQLAETTRKEMARLGDAFVAAALVRTLERLTGRSPEPLARELGRRSFEAALSEAAGLPPPAPKAPMPGLQEDRQLEPRDTKDMLILPVPGYMPPLSTDRPPPPTVTNPR